MYVLYVNQGEHDASGSVASTTDHSRRFYVQRSHDGGEGEDRKHLKRHDWFVRGRRSLGESSGEDMGQSMAFMYLYESGVK